MRYQLSGGIPKVCVSSCDVSCNLVVWREIGQVEGEVYSIQRDCDLSLRVDGRCLAVQADDFPNYSYCAVHELLKVGRVDAGGCLVRHNWWKLGRRVTVKLQARN